MNEETVEQILENPYLPAVIYWFDKIPTPGTLCTSLLVDVRKRMGQAVFDEFHETIVETVERRKTKKAVTTAQ